MEELLKSLNNLERTVLPILKKESDVKLIAKEAKLQEIEVMRALQWLSNKDLVKISSTTKETVDLDDNGKKYAKNNLPEYQFLKALEKPLSLSELSKKSGLDRNEINISIGLLKRKALINVKKEKELMFSITENGKKFLKKEPLEQKFLKNKFPMDFSELKDEDKFALEELKKRKSIIKLNSTKAFSAELTEKGKKVDMNKLGSGSIEKLTPAVLKSGKWKGKEFRRYDVEINVPAVHGGKRHFVSQAINYAKRIWTDMGFVEMEGPILNTSFWNFDALFQPQDHPARDLQDTFYIKNPRSGKIDPKFARKVKKAHESGVDGSKGWQYRWSQKEAEKNVLRTHTTVLSARTIAKIKESDLPCKFFAVGKCFRNESVDYKHHFEFNQTEGIVVDPNANFRHLIGYLREFFKKMGYPKARFRPGHFPYTEPSLEIEVFHPVFKEWVELGGSGIFRPEVVEPLLGKPIPVLAWGPGFDRILMEYYNISDLRTMYSNDIKQLREMKAWMR